MDYPFHKGARTSLLILALLCFVLIVAIPVAIWVLWRRANGKIIFKDDGVRAQQFGNTQEFSFRDVARLGLCRVPVYARGIGGMLVKQRMGGNQAVHVVVKLLNGQQKDVIISSFEKWDEIQAKIASGIGKPYEPMTTGLMGMKWPKDASS